MKKFFRYISVLLLFFLVSSCEKAKEENSSVHVSDLTQDEEVKMTEGYLFPFGLEIPEEAKMLSEEEKGDCTRSWSEYNVNDSIAIQKIVVDCYDYGKEMQYFLVLNGALKGLHRMSEVAMPAQESTKYEYLEEVYAITDSGHFTHFERRDTLSQKPTEGFAVIEEEFKINKEKPSISSEAIQELFQKATQQ